MFKTFDESEPTLTFDSGEGLTVSIQAARANPAGGWFYRYGISADNGRITHEDDVLACGTGFANGRPLAFMLSELFGFLSDYAETPPSDGPLPSILAALSDAGWTAIDFDAFGELVHRDR